MIMLKMYYWTEYRKKICLPNTVKMKGRLPITIALKGGYKLGSQL